MALAFVLFAASEIMPGRLARAQISAPAQAQPDFESEWQWLLAEFPEARAYTPSEKAVLPIQDLMAWAGKANGIDIFDWGCRRIHVQKKDGAFQGHVDIGERVEPDGQAKLVWYNEASFGLSVDVIDGSSISYRKAQHGWVETGRQGYSAILFGSLLLSKVSREAAWFGAAEVALSPECVERTDEVMSCTEAGTRTCSWCSQWSLKWSRLSGPLIGMRHTVRDVTVTSTQRADCSEPCTQPEVPASVRRAERLLKGRSFIYDTVAEHPLIFRTQAACRRYRRENHIPTEDSRPW